MVKVAVGHLGCIATRHGGEEGKQRIARRQHGSPGGESALVVVHRAELLLFLRTRDAIRQDEERDLAISAQDQGPTWTATMASWL